MFWSVHSGIIAATSIILARYIAYFIPLDDFGIRVTAIGGIAVVSFINFLGVRQARQLGTLVYRMLRWGRQYVDIGQQAYEEQHQAAKLRALVSTAAQLGYHLVKQPEALHA